ncbi:hypothetical protein ABW21_db0203237 [Orbilia brochopaga]|nr:hypothetical protein ABW21_db0203237 [Drechslerella brochopaga]
MWVLSIFCFYFLSPPFFLSCFDMQCFAASPFDAGAGPQWYHSVTSPELVLKVNMSGRLLVDFHNRGFVVSIALPVSREGCSIERFRRIGMMLFRCVTTTTVLRATR